jgi:hypothetical protein
MAKQHNNNGGNQVSNRIIIPARGTVEFLVFNMGDDYPTQLEIDGVKIDGQIEWSRPVVGLVFTPGVSVVDDQVIWGKDPLRAEKDGDWLHADEIIVDEGGSVYLVREYLHRLVGDCHWECAMHFYRPHIDGPVTDAPAIREVPRKAAIQ